MVRTVVGFVLALALLACNGVQRQLENVAKDWCLTIRASQVLPVYPPNEDVQPGDVFLVSAPLSEQTKVYEEKGFLPLDQLVTRLDGLPYDVFYANAYWSGNYAGVPHGRPGFDDAEPPPAALAPRVAFPAYSFSYEAGTGLKLAIPVQGVPVGLGIMGSKKASGTVTLKDAYSYAMDGETMLRRLYAWYHEDPDIRSVLRDMAQASTKEIYLRVVTRVFIVRQITVSLTNEDSLAAGLDVGAAPELKLLEMSTRDPGAAEDSTAAYAKTLEALSNEGKIVPEGAAPGGAFRFAQASSRAVTMNETFKRPLVIGYLGFDVRVYEDGFLSVPIPSFATITGKATATAYTELSKDTRAKFAAMKEMSSADLDSLPDAKLDAAWQAAVEVGLLGADVRLPRGNFKDTPEGKRAFLKAISQPDDRPGRMEQIEEFRAKLAGL